MLCVQDLNAHNVSNVMHALGVLRHTPADHTVLDAIDAVLPDIIDDMTMEVRPLVGLPLMWRVQLHHHAPQHTCKTPDTLQVCLNTLHLHTLSHHRGLRAWH